MYARLVSKFKTLNKNIKLPQPALQKRPISSTPMRKWPVLRTNRIFWSTSLFAMGLTGMAFAGHRKQAVSPVDQHIEKLKKAYNEKNHEEQIKEFKYLGNAYLKEKNYLYAVACYQFALGACNKVKTVGLFDCAAYVNELNQLTDQACHLYLKEICNVSSSVSFAALSEQHKKRLKEIREEAAKQIDLPQADIEIIYRTISRRMIEEFFAKMIEDAQKIWRMQDYISCESAFVGFGSLARNEATPYSDLEFGVLVSQDTPEITDYFVKLTRLIFLMLINLGETPPRILDMESLRWIDDQESPVMKGVSFDGFMPSACKTPLGNRHIGLADRAAKETFELILTPEQMAELHDEKHSVMDKHLSTVLNTCVLISGNENLVSTYRNRARQVLECEVKVNQVKMPLRESRAFSLLNESLYRFVVKTGVANKEGRTFDIKYDLYRLPNMFIDHLAMYYGIAGNSTWDKIDKLWGEQGIFPNRLACRHLKEIVSKILRIRLKNYLSAGYRHDEFHLERNDLFLIYQTFIPLSGRVREMLHTGRVVFSDQFFYDPFLLAKGEVHRRIGEYDEALTAYNGVINSKQGYTAEDKINALTSKADIYLARREKESAVGACDEALKMTAAQKALGGFQDEKIDEGKIYLVRGEASGGLQKADFEAALSSDRQQKMRGARNDFDLATTLLNYAIYLQNCNELTEAEVKLKEAETLYLNVVNQDHPYMGSVYNLYSTLLLHRHRLEKNLSSKQALLEEAHQKCQRGLCIRKREYGEFHLKYAESLNNMGSILSAKLQLMRIRRDFVGGFVEGSALFTGAESCYQKAIDIYKKNPELSGDYLLTEINLAGFYFSNGQRESSKAKFEEIVLIAKSQNAYENLVAAYEGLAKIYFYEGDRERAVLVLEEAFQMASEKLGPGHYYTQYLNESLQAAKSTPVSKL